MSISAVSSSSSSMQSIWEELNKTGTTEDASQQEAIFNLAATGQDTGGTEASQNNAPGESSKTYDPLDTNEDGIVSDDELEKAAPLQRSALGTRARMAEQGIGPSA